MAWFYINGEFIEREQAMLPVGQTGILRSYGIFDLFRTISKQPRFLEDYLRRFSNSQKFLGLSRAIESEEVQGAISELQRRNDFEHSTFKLVLLGDGPDGAAVYDPFFYVMNLPLNTEKPPSIKVISHEYVREFSEVKSLNYLTTFSLTRKKAAAGASEVIYHKDGLVSEAARCNVFAISDGVLRTPSKFILKGITRMHVMETAKQLMDVKEEDLSLDDLLSADEVFVTSTTKDVMPVTQIDDQLIGAGTPGPVSLRLQKAFASYCQEQLLTT